MEINVFTNYASLFCRSHLVLLCYYITFILDVEKKRYVYFSGFHYKTSFSLS